MQPLITVKWKASWFAGIKDAGSVDLRCIRIPCIGEKVQLQIEGSTKNLYVHDVIHRLVEDAHRGPVATIEVDTLPPKVP